MQSGTEPDGVFCLGFLAGCYSHCPRFWGSAERSGEHRVKSGIGVCRRPDAVLPLSQTGFLKPRPAGPEYGARGDDVDLISKESLKIHRFADRRCVDSLADDVERPLLWLPPDEHRFGWSPTERTI